MNEKNGDKRNSKTFAAISALFSFCHVESFFIILSIFPRFVLLHDHPTFLASATQIDICMRDVQIFKESLTHLLVIVLTGMRQTILKNLTLNLRLLYSVNDRSYPHKNRACPCNNSYYIHFFELFFANLINGCSIA
jgi:hypothetical protein